jgi:hypothetical protein
LLTELPTEHTVLGARLRAMLATELSYDPAHTGDAEELCEQAVNQIRAATDRTPQDPARVLQARPCPGSPTTTGPPVGHRPGTREVGRRRRRPRRDRKSPPLPVSTAADARPPRRGKQDPAVPPSSGPPMPGGR